MYMECSCVTPKSEEYASRLIDLVGNHTEKDEKTPVGVAFQGSCPVDCTHKFYVFLAVVCLLKFSGATGRASNFLVSVR